jgi:hypothetical protein
MIDIPWSKSYALDLCVQYFLLVREKNDDAAINRIFSTAKSSKSDRVVARVFGSLLTDFDAFSYNSNDSTSSSSSTTISISINKETRNTNNSANGANNSSANGLDASLGQAMRMASESIPTQTHTQPALQRGSIHGCNVASRCCHCIGVPTRELATIGSDLTVDRGHDESRQCLLAFVHYRYSSYEYRQR